MPPTPPFPFLVADRCLPTQSRSCNCNCIRVRVRVNERVEIPERNAGAANGRATCVGETAERTGRGGPANGKRFHANARTNPPVPFLTPQARVLGRLNRRPAPLATARSVSEGGVVHWCRGRPTTSQPGGGTVVRCFWPESTMVAGAVRQLIPRLRLSSIGRCVCAHELLPTRPRF